MKIVNMAVLIGLLGVVAPVFAEVPWCEMPEHGAAINEKKLAELKEEQRVRRVNMNYSGRHEKRTLEELNDLSWNDQVFSNDAKGVAQARAAYLAEKDKQIKAREWRDFGRINPTTAEQRFAKIAKWERLERSLYSGWDPEWSLRKMEKQNEALKKENEALKAKVAAKEEKQKNSWFSRK